MNDIQKIFVAIGLIVGIAILLALAISFVSAKFKVVEDERKAKLMTLLPGANCGACGYAGCSALADAVISGKVTKIKTCKVINAENAQKAADYINGAEGPDGSKLHVTVA